MPDVIREFEINGLKAFNQRALARMAPITLVFGTNSAGKSSILQALLLLKQTLETSPTGDLQPQGPNVDLGSYANLVTAHDLDRSVHLRLGVGSKDLGLSFGMRFAGRDELGLEVSVGWAHAGNEVDIAFARRADQRTEAGPLWSAEAWPSPNLVAWVAAVLGDRMRVPAGWIAARDAAERAGGFDKDLLPWDGLSTDDVARAVEDLGGHVVASPGARKHAASRWLPATFADPPDDPAARAVRAVIEAAIDCATDAALEAVEGLAYLGPARTAPPRLAVQKSGVPRELGSNGDFMAQRLAGDSALQETVNGHLKQLGLRYRLEVAPIDVSDPLLRDTFTIRLLDDSYGEPLPINVADVGYGISQILPVIVAGAISRQGTVMVEQPELHIHPGLQARYGEILAAQSTHARFIVETHSEHLMLRLLAKVRRRELDADHISVLYVDQPDREGSVLRRLEIDETGDFLDWWPHGFFTERQEELFDPPATT